MAYIMIQIVFFPIVLLCHPQDFEKCDDVGFLHCSLFSIKLECLHYSNSYKLFSASELFSTQLNIPSGLTIFCLREKLLLAKLLFCKIRSARKIQLSENQPLRNGENFPSQGPINTLTIPVY